MSSRADGDVPAGCLLMSARRHLVSSATAPTRLLAQPGGVQLARCVRRGLDGACPLVMAARRAPMAWATWRSPLARWSSPRRRAAGWDCLVVISSSSLALSISLGPSAGRSTQATSRASQPARLPRTAGRRRSARALFQMRPRTGGGGGPAPQAPPPTALPRRRVARSVILRGWAGDPSREPLLCPVGPRQLSLGAPGSGWGGGSGHGWPPLGPPAFTEGPSSLLALLAFVAAGLDDGRVLQRPVARTHNVPCIHENIFWKSEAGFSSIGHPLGLSDKPRPRPCMCGS